MTLIREPSLLMEIIKDNLGDMGCLKMQRTNKARASKTKRETVKCAERLTDGTSYDGTSAEDEEDRKQQMDIER